jgi:hypothetical protein
MRKGISCTLCITATGKGELTDGAIGAGGGAFLGAAALAADLK